MVQFAFVVCDCDGDSDSDNDSGSGGGNDRSSILWMYLCLMYTRCTRRRILEPCTHSNGAGMVSAISSRWSVCVCACVRACMRE